MWSKKGLNQGLWIHTLYFYFIFIFCLIKKRIKKIKPHINRHLSAALAIMLSIPALFKYVQFSMIWVLLFLGKKKEMLDKSIPLRINRGIEPQNCFLRSRKKWVSNPNLFFVSSPHWLPNYSYYGYSFQVFLIPGASEKQITRYRCIIRQDDYLYVLAYWLLLGKLFRHQKSNVVTFSDFFRASSTFESVFFGWYAHHLL